MRLQLEGLIAKGVADARDYIRAQRRERALLCLRKNKLYEHDVERIDAYLLNVEQACQQSKPERACCHALRLHTLKLARQWRISHSTKECGRLGNRKIILDPVKASDSHLRCVQILANIEAAQRTNRLFSALKEGNAAMTQLQRQVKLEDVEQLNEETAEAAEYQQRVRELLEQSLSAQDDAEALEELEKIQVGTWLHAHDNLNSCCLSTVKHSHHPQRQTARAVTRIWTSVSALQRCLRLGRKGSGLLLQQGMSAVVNIICWQAAQEEEEAAALPSVPAPTVEEAAPQPELPAVPTVSPPTPTQYFSHGSCVGSQGQKCVVSPCAAVCSPDCVLQHLVTLPPAEQPQAETKRAAEEPLAA